MVHHSWYIILTSSIDSPLRPITFSVDNILAPGRFGGIGAEGGDPFAASPLMAAMAAAAAAAAAGAGPVPPAPPHGNHHHQVRFYVQQNQLRDTKALISHSVFTWIDL